jgi:hypothetical protein
VTRSRTARLHVPTTCSTVQSTPFGYGIFSGTSRVSGLNDDTGGDSRDTGGPASFDSADNDDGGDQLILTIDGGADTAADPPLVFVSLAPAHIRWVRVKLAADAFALAGAPVALKWAGIRSDDGSLALLANRIVLDSGISGNTTASASLASSSTVASTSSPSSTSSLVPASLAALLSGPVSLTPLIVPPATATIATAVLLSDGLSLLAVGTDGTVYTGTRSTDGSGISSGDATGGIIAAETCAGGVLVARGTGAFSGTLVVARSGVYDAAAVRIASAHGTAAGVTCDPLGRVLAVEVAPDLRIVDPTGLGGSQRAMLVRRAVVSVSSSLAAVKAAPHVPVSPTVDTVGSRVDVDVGSGGLRNGVGARRVSFAATDKATGSSSAGGAIEITSSLVEAATADGTPGIMLTGRVVERAGDSDGSTAAPVRVIPASGHNVGDFVALRASPNPWNPGHLGATVLTDFGAFRVIALPPAVSPSARTPSNAVPRSATDQSALFLGASSGFKEDGAAVPSSRRSSSAASAASSAAAINLLPVSNLAAEHDDATGEKRSTLTADAAGSAAAQRAQTILARLAALDPATDVLAVVVSPAAGTVDAGAGGAWSVVRGSAFAEAAHGRVTVPGSGSSPVPRGSLPAIEVDLAGSRGWRFSDADIGRVAEFGTGWGIVTAVHGGGARASVAVQEPLPRGVFEIGEWSMYDVAPGLSIDAGPAPHPLALRASDVSLAVPPCHTVSMEATITANGRLLERGGLVHLDRGGTIAVTVVAIPPVDLSYQLSNAAVVRVFSRTTRSTIRNGKLASVMDLVIAEASTLGGFGVDYDPFAEARGLASSLTNTGNDDDDDNNGGGNGAAAAVDRRGGSVLAVQSASASLRCFANQVVVPVRVGCPPTLRVVEENPLTWPRVASDRTAGTELTGFNFHDLPTNYRPPSELGRAVPTTDNFYNADPSRSRGGRFPVSRNSGIFKQCAGAEDRAGCRCTERQTLSQLVAESDCIVTAREVFFKSRYVPRFRMREDGVDTGPLRAKFRLIELNGRTDYCFNTSSSCPKGDREELEATLLDPEAFHAISWSGEELFHFRAEVVSDSYCSVATEFTVWVIASPLQTATWYTVVSSTAIISALTLIFGYAWYSSVKGKLHGT